jgi:hypothetical protein
MSKIHVSRNRSSAQDKFGEKLHPHPRFQNPYTHVKEGNLGELYLCVRELNPWV